MSEVRPKRVCSPKYALMKAKKGKVLNKWELEDLAQSRDYAHEYARLKGSFPEAEPVFLKAIQENDFNSNDVRHFILYHFKTDRSVVERIFLKQVGLVELAKFAECAIKGRWPEAEKKILCERYASREYHKDVVKGRWEEFEDVILFSSKKRWKQFASNGWMTEPRYEVLEEYLAVSGPHPEIERKLENSSPSLLVTYAIKGIKGRLPPHLHQKVLLSSFSDKKKWAKRYVKFIQSRERGVIRYLSSLSAEERLELVRKTNPCAVGVA